MPAIDTTRGTFWIADHRHDKQRIPSIVIHGAGGSHLSFPKELRRSKITNAIFPDLSGHGLSKGSGHQTIVHYAQDIVALMDALELPQAILMGHSMGGAIAQWLTIEYPKRVKSLVLIGTGAKLAVNPMMIDGILKDTYETIATVNGWMWAKSASEELREQSAQMMHQTKPSVIQGDYIACDHFDVRDRLQEITVPTLVIAGEHDKMIRVNRSEELAENIPNADFVMLSRAGHMMMLEQPAETVQAIENWLSKL